MTVKLPKYRANVANVSEDAMVNIIPFFTLMVNVYYSQVCVTLSLLFKFKAVSFLAFSK